MFKTRTIPAHEERYTVCDYCGEEINDYSSTNREYADGTVRHFHSMHAGGKKGVVKKTCAELWDAREIKQILKKRK